MLPCDFPRLPQEGVDETDEHEEDEGTTACKEGSHRLGSEEGKTDTEGKEANGEATDDEREKQVTHGAR